MIKIYADTKISKEYLTELLLLGEEIRLSLPQNYNSFDEENILDLLCDKGLAEKTTICIQSSQHGRLSYTVNKYYIIIKTIVHIHGDRFKLHYNKNQTIELLSHFNFIND